MDNYSPENALNLFKLIMTMVDIQKYTVLYGFWAGGFISPVFCEDTNERPLTVYGGDYKQMIGSLLYEKEIDIVKIINDCQLNTITLFSLSFFE